MQSYLITQIAAGGQGLPNTAMAHAFMRALIRVAERHYHNVEIMLPTGTASAGELKLVLRNLKLLHGKEHP